MAKAKDYKLDNDLDLIIYNGDFVKDESDQTSSILLINTYKGAWKFSPFTGVGIKRFLGSSNTQQEIRREIVVQHQADGLKVISISVKDYSDFSLDIKREGYE